MRQRMRCTEIILELKSASGTKQKLAVLENNKSNVKFLELLRYAVDDSITFYLSESRLKSAEPLAKPMSDSIFKYFAQLSGRKWGLTDSAVSDVKAFLLECPEPDRDVFEKILCKKFKVGLTVTSINKVIPGFIHEYGVQQAFPIEKYPPKEGEYFWLTQKLNGVRAVFDLDGNFHSRGGGLYSGLEHIKREMMTLCESFDGVFDGELLLRDDVREELELGDNEAFRMSTGIINSDAENKPEIQFVIYDAVPRMDWNGWTESDFGAYMYGLRRSTIDSMACLNRNFKYVKFLPVLYEGTDQTMIWRLLDQMVAEDKEGLMLNLNTPYLRKRHRGILKVKRFYTMDLPIVDAEEGGGKLEGTLGALVVEYKGNKVRVGSGFSNDQRDSIWADRDDIVNSCLCEVKYKEISSDKKTGLESLQFPIFVRIRTDKSEASYG